MTSDINALRERYLALSDDELQNLALSRGLTEQAREILEQELRRRGIQDVAEYKEQLESYDRNLLEEKQQALERREKRIRLENRIGFGVAFLGLLIGLYMRLVQHDERNGVGVIIASFILFPVVWILAWISRLVWRFLLRP